jgi:hypothetical protein
VSHTVVPCDTGTKAWLWKLQFSSQPDCFSDLVDAKFESAVACKLQLCGRTIPSKTFKLLLACWPLEPKVAGSNPAEAVGFFRAKKSSAGLPSEGK